MKTFLNRTFLALCLGLSLLPGLLLLLGVKSPDYENRPLAPEPKLIANGAWNVDFFSDLDDWFSDHYALRPQLVSLGNRLAAFFGDSLGGKVIVGEDGWLFFPETVPDYLHERRLSAHDEACLARTLRIYSDAAEEAGSSLLFTVAPNKNTIYPERMPDRYQPLPQGSDLENLTGFLAGAGVPCVDLATLLTEHRHEGLYYAQDSHWNDRGANLVYEALMARIAPTGDWPRYEADEARIVYDHSGDLHKMLYPAVMGRDLRYDFALPRSWTSDSPRVDVSRQQEVTTHNPEGTGSLWVFRDSFGISLHPFFAQAAEELRYSSAVPYDLTALKDNPPDAIVIEIVERNLPQLLSQPAKIYGPRVSLTEEAKEIPCHWVWEKERISGTFPMEGYDPMTQHIVLELPDGTCVEALPLGDAPHGEQAFTLYLPDGAPETLTLYLQERSE